MHVGEGLHTVSPLLRFLVMTYITQCFLNRWTVVYYHVIGTHFYFLLLELRADAGMFLRDVLLFFIKLAPGNFGLVSNL